MGPVGDFSDLLFLVLVIVAVVKSFFFFSVSWVSLLLGGLVG